MSLTEKEMKWDKLDNTALLFPVIANESMSSVYRISVTLTEDIIEEKLQEALSRVLPKFDVFHVRLRRGLFWYDFETNNRPAPKVREEQQLSVSCDLLSETDQSGGIPCADGRYGRDNLSAGAGL